MDPSSALEELSSTTAHGAIADVEHPHAAAASGGHGSAGGHGSINGSLVRHCPKVECSQPIIIRAWHSPWTSNGTHMLTISTGEQIGQTMAYIAALAYLFLGMSMVADRFVAAIEVIVSKKRTVKTVSPTTGQVEFVQVPVWNETVAHLTLLVLGGCAPEILLSIVETCTSNFEAGELGPAVIVGSGCYNLFIITGICIGSVSGPAKRISELPVFFTTAFFSIFAYAWLYFIVEVNSYAVIEVWEALATLAFFPVLVVSAYTVDKNFFGIFNCCCRNKEVHPSSQADSAKENLEKREKRFMAILEELRAKNPTKTTNQLQEMAELELLKEIPKGRNFYKMQAARQMTGGGDLINKEKLREKITKNTNKKHLDPDLQVISFDPPTYTVMEDCGQCQINVVREGQNIKNIASVDYCTKDGTGKNGADYRQTSGRLHFVSGETLKHIAVDIIDDDTYQADTMFYVVLSNAHLESKKGRAILNENSTATITKLDDDHGGIFHFVSGDIEVGENSGQAKIKVLRSSGAKGAVSMPVKITPFTAQPGVHYQDPKIKQITFQDRQVDYDICFNVVDEGKVEPKAVQLYVEIGQPKWLPVQKIGSFNPDKLGKPTLKKPSQTTVTITENKNLKRIITEIAEADMGEFVGTSTWSEQFVAAFTVPTAEPENDGDPPKKTWWEYIAHIVTFFWKFLFAFIPPSTMLGGWAAFFVAFAMIGFMTAVIGDLANCIGCTVGLADDLTAVTFVSLGTSLPDLFASRIAAIREETADAAIGHVSGANAVNVFLGIGLAWSIAAIENRYVQNKALTLQVGSFSFCIILFFSFTIIAVVVLFLRRLPPIRGELGGPRVAKYVTVGLFWSLWAAYIILVALDSYCVIDVTYIETFFSKQ